MHLQLRVTGLLPFIHVVVTEEVASAFTPHSKRTSVPRMTFMFFGFVTNKMGSKKNGEYNMTNQTIKKCDGVTLKCAKM